MKTPRPAPTNPEAAPLQAFGVPASAGGASANTGGLNVPLRPLQARSGPAKAGTPNAGPNEPTPIPGGPEYWRGLDELAGTPEFRAWVEKEFPARASELKDPVTRRHFVKLMSASFLLAGLGLSGCRRPPEKILPFAKQPENSPHGIPQYFATALPSRRGAIPLVVKSSEGRPIKIEGNPEHPEGVGGTDAFAQAALLGLYDPDRAHRFAENGVTRSRAEAMEFLGTLGRKLQASGGRGLAILGEQSNSPSRERLKNTLWPQARWFCFEPIDFDIHRAAASAAFGQSVQPRYKIDQAKVILTFDCDFLGTEENASAHIRQFAQGRLLASAADSMSRLYAVESLFTLTGANADHRLRVPPSMLLPIIARFAMEILGHRVKGFGPLLKDLAANAIPHESWIVPCARDLVAHGGASLILAGHRLPLSAHLLVLAMNAKLGSGGRCMELRQTENPGEGSLPELVQALKAGEVETLVILGGNPVYNAPVELDWLHAQARAKIVIRLGAYEDETAWSAPIHAPTHWDIPAAHFLESWGDARSHDGTLISIQPLIEPLFGGLTELELLARQGGLEKTDPHELVRQTFFEHAGVTEESWKRFLHNGFLDGSSAKTVNVEYQWTEAAQLFQASLKPPGKTSGLEIVIHRDASLDDGRHANNGWLQELPDPVTKLTWDNAVLISPKTADDLTVKAGDVVEIELDQRTLRGPVWVQPGQADGTLGLALGYGRSRAGRVGNKSGFNAYLLRTGNAPHYASGAQLRITGAQQTLATTQSHWSMEARGLVREATLKEYRQNPAFAHITERFPAASLYSNPLESAAAATLHQWGMVIDLNACVGCSACVAACQSENNIPIVGREMVAKSREMHWLRIDRYYSGPPADPRAVAQPMLCQHCEAAPCENVCPVNATTHDEEGLNVMVYNRCVGSRYCSNNCPFKVRRFNFFDYNRRPLDRLYESPLASRTEGEWDIKRWLKNPDRGSRPEDEWQMLQLAQNPDVSVRMRGVMEKCTFCVQRIEQAKISRKIKAGESGQIRLSEAAGTVPQTACQQACPAGAIVFGDLSDPQSQVARLKRLDRNYGMLESLHLQPRLTYLAKVRNPNPEMPDSKEARS